MFMKKNKKTLILSIVGSIGIIVLFVCLVIVGATTGNKVLVVYSLLGLVLFLVYLVSEIISPGNKSENPTTPEYDEQSLANGDGLSNQEKELLNKYLDLKDDRYNEVGYVSFVNEGIKFSAEGKYGCAKDFNGKPGYHLGFNLKGLKLVDKPEDYEDVVGYDDLLFDINLGYFDDSFLSEPENDNGIIVKDINNLEGKTIDISGAEGYIAQINTAESDDIDVGEIKFVEWNEKSKIIQFKLVVSYGLCDVVAGTIKLTEDTYEE